ncbi:YncE family protein [Streptomyces swartbergensis]|uniref:YncE family protein n=1 Tax=Streptomyces swartbergensis TaxID=487165 RepID=UPI00117D198A|nr:hypothetical protein [Streptomyces swartbergensis]
MSPDPGRVYVTHCPFDSVPVMDPGRECMAGTIPVGGATRGLAASPYGTRLCVTNFFAGTVSVIRL